MIECLHFANPSEVMALDNDCQFSVSVTREKRASHDTPYVELTQYHLYNRTAKENSCLEFHQPIFRKYEKTEKWPETTQGIWDFLGSPIVNNVVNNMLCNAECASSIPVREIRLHLPCNQKNHKHKAEAMLWQIGTLPQILEPLSQAYEMHYFIFSYYKIFRKEKILNLLLERSVRDGNGRMSEQLEKNKRENKHKKTGQSLCQIIIKWSKESSIVSYFILYLIFIPPDYDTSFIFNWMCKLL